MPNLTEVRLPKPFKHRDDIHIESRSFLYQSLVDAGAFAGILDQPLPDSDEDCCILCRVCYDELILQKSKPSSCRILLLSCIVEYFAMLDKTRCLRCISRKRGFLFLFPFSYSYHS